MATNVSYEVVLSTVISVRKDAIINRTVWDEIEDIIYRLKDSLEDDDIIYISDWDITTHED